MYKHISYTAAYAEMARCILHGVEAFRLRDTVTAIRNFERAAQLAERANLGPEAVIGSYRNLAGAHSVAGHLTQAERVLRDLLAHPALSDNDRPLVLHELGTTLALAGSPEASDVLSAALDQYTDQKSRLLCALDLAELWLAKGEPQRGYDLLAAVVRPEDGPEHPERFCRVQLLMARCALALQQVDLANAHLESAHSALSAANIPILRSLYLAIVAEREYQEGQVESAQARCVAALEQALTEVELENGEVLRTIATIFHRLFGTSSN